MAFVLQLLGHPPVEELHRLEAGVGTGQIHLHPGDVDHPGSVTGGAAGLGGFGPGESLLHQPVGQAAHRRKADSLVVELVCDHPPPTVEFADEVGRWHVDILVIRGRRDHRADGDDWGTCEAGEVGRHQDHRDSLVLGDVRIGADCEPHVVGLVGARREDLRAVDHPLVAVTHGLGAQRREIGPGIGLGVADCEVDLAGEDLREVFGLLLVRAECHDRRTDGVQGDEWKRGAGPLNLVEKDELIRRRTPLAAVLLGPTDTEPAVGPHLADDRVEQRAALARDPESGPDLGCEQVGEVLP